MKSKILLLVSFLGVVALVSTLYVVLGNGFSNNSLTTDEKKYEIYILASTTGGYTGTYEEWLASISGNELELRINGTVLEWKYVDASNDSWTVLYDMSSLQGSDGADGANGTNGTNGENGTNGLSAYEVWLEFNEGKSQNDFFSSLNVYALWLAQGNEGSEDEFLNSLKGETGEDGEDYSEALYYIYQQFGYTGSYDDFKNIVFDDFDLDFGLLETKYTVEYDLDGGIYLYEYNTTFTEDSPLVLHTPTKTGYTFDGWEGNNEVTYESGSTITTLDEHLTLTAKWEVNTYDVYYVCNDILIDQFEYTVLTDLEVKLSDYTNYDIKYYSNKYLTKEIVNEKITNDLIVNDEIIIYMEMTLIVTNNQIKFGKYTWNVLYQSAGYVRVIAAESVYEGNFDENVDTDYESSNICKALNSEVFTTKFTKYEQSQMILTLGDNYLNYFTLPSEDYISSNVSTMMESWSYNGTYYYEGEFFANDTLVEKKTFPIVTIKL